MTNLRTAALVVAALAGITLSVAAARAGAVGGPKGSVTTVAPHGSDIYEVGFRAGEPAVVVVRGDGDTDLDLYIYDENGNLVASDTDDTDDCMVRWVPRWTGRFVIKVVNRGSVDNRYQIQTN